MTIELAVMVGLLAFSPLLGRGVAVLLHRLLSVPAND